MKIVTILITFILMTIFSVHAMIPPLPPGQVFKFRTAHSSGFSLTLDDINTLYCFKTTHDNAIFGVLDNPYGGRVVMRPAAHYYYATLAQRYRHQRIKKLLGLYYFCKAT